MRRPPHRKRNALLDAPLPGDWAEHAACKGLAPTDGVTEHPFFPTRGERVPAAMEVCASCPVLAYCRHYALRYPVLGVWAGLPEVDRKRWRREQRRSA